MIYLIEADDKVRSAVKTALFPEDSPTPELFVSALTRLECRVWPLREKNENLLREFDRFFSSRDLRRVRLTVEVFDLATELRADYGLKTPDAIHLAAAITRGCDAFWTNDQRIPSALGERISIRELP